MATEHSQEERVFGKVDAKLTPDNLGSLFTDFAGIGMGWAYTRTEPQQTVLE